LTATQNPYPLEGTVGRSVLNCWQSYPFFLTSRNGVMAA
jgi:hypothetical protein